MDLVLNGDTFFVALGNHDDDACPICQYLAQGKIVAARFEAISVPVSVANRSLRTSLATPTPELQLFQARAPPAA